MNSIPESRSCVGPTSNDKLISEIIHIQMIATQGNMGIMASFHIENNTGVVYQVKPRVGEVIGIRSIVPPRHHPIDCCNPYTYTYDQNKYFNTH
jgi:hypothetical protein